MATDNDISQIQPWISNRLEPSSIGRRKIAAVIGDAPSHYSKSPALWNSAFRDLHVDAVYLPFDVEEPRLGGLIRTLKQCGSAMGANVTVPYKVKVMEYLDRIDEKARRIQAVNTIVREEDGSLVGYNTDGDGFLESLLKPRPGRDRPFVESLKGMDVLMIGAGGSARAVAFCLAEALEGGRLFICNRTAAAARSLAREVKSLFGNASAIQELEIAEKAPRVGLIVNCSTKGQGGIRKGTDGTISILEPYSALAPANPAALPGSLYGKPEFYRDWLSASLSDIEANHQASWEIALSIPLGVGFCDLIYFPEETVFLRHGRLSGHRTLSGKGMIVAQAVEAFFKICEKPLREAGLYNPETRKQLTEIMHGAW